MKKRSKTNDTVANLSLVFCANGKFRWKVLHSMCNLTLKISVECFLYITQMMLVGIDDTDWAADTWILGSISLCSQLIVSFKIYHQVRKLTNTLQLLTKANTKGNKNTHFDKYTHWYIDPGEYLAMLSTNWDDMELVMLHLKSVERRNQNNLSNLWAFSLPCLFAWSAFDLTQNMISFPCSYNAIQQLRNECHIQTQKTSDIKSKTW